MSTPFPRPAADACSVLSANLAESAYGSAADATSWVYLEQNGPWGRVAASDSHLDPGLGGRLDAAVSGAGGRFALIRRPGAHPDDVLHQGPRTVLVASVTGRGWALRGQLTDPADLLALDVGALARADRAAVMASMPTLVPDLAPTLLICTNGRRDVCCAIRGRPVALGAAAQLPGRVWETSHTGGHRYAPTGVLLPSGATLARLDVPLAVQALAAAARDELPTGLHGPVHDRGASGLPAHQRAAVSAVRHAAAVEGLHDLSAADIDPADGDPGQRVVVRHVDGRAWSVLAARVTRGPDRPESCVKAAVPQVVWTTTVYGDGAPD